LCRDQVPGGDTGSRLGLSSARGERETQYQGEPRAKPLAEDSRGAGHPVSASDARSSSETRRVPRRQTLTAHSSQLTALQTPQTTSTPACCARWIISMNGVLRMRRLTLSKFGGGSPF